VWGFPPLTHLERVGAPLVDGEPPKGFGNLPLGSLSPKGLNFKYPPKKLPPKGF